jgi:hypothetical protein
VPTDCNSQPIRFTPLGRRSLLADFDGGRITSDAGALLLREVAGRSKLFTRMAACVPDPREPSMIEHDQQTMLAQRVLGIACGWEDLNDHHGLRIDPLMQVASESRRGASVAHPRRTIDPISPDSSLEATADRQHLVFFPAAAVFRAFLAGLHASAVCADHQKLMLVLRTIRQAARLEALQFLLSRLDQGLTQRFG